MSQAVRLIRLSLSGNCVFAVRFHVQTALEQKIDRCARYIKKHQGDNVSLDRTMLKDFDPVYYHEGKEDQKLMSAVERTDVCTETIVNQNKRH